MSKAKLVIKITDTEHGFGLEYEVYKENGSSIAGALATAITEHLPALLDHLGTLVNEEEKQDATH